MSNDLPALAKLVRYYSLISTTAAGSGHPTSSLSAADLMTSLMFGGCFNFDLDHPENPDNDRLIFSKGHASPLFYSLYAAAGKVSEQEMLSLRKSGSKLEGHPTMQFPYTEVPTGSLGQGLSVGVGMALNAKYLDKTGYRTFVLLGDGEMAEGSVWEAMQSAAFYELNNLVAILDVNRLGQSRETMLGWHTESYEARAKAFGWDTMVIDGHNLEEIAKAYQAACKSADKPTMIIAKTVKGKGISFLEDKEGWHGKPLSQEQLQESLRELGPVDKSMVGEVSKPAKAEILDSRSDILNKSQIQISKYEKPTATRKAYGNALVNAFEAYPNIVVLDGETSNSTFSETFRKVHPENYFEMFIAEQNMVGAALGLSRRGKIPFLSTFAAFLTRAFDQIRMSQYSQSNIKICGSHAGVSIGEDGSSQMALEDIVMFRSLLDQVVLYPSDAVSTEKLVALAAAHQGNVYIRTTRKETPLLYAPETEFKIGGSFTLAQSPQDAVTIIGAGVTLHEALAAHIELHEQGISARVIDLYSIKPVDVETLRKAAAETKAIVTVEDHHPEGGIGEAVRSAVGDMCPVYSLAVTREPHSAKPDELLAFEQINKAAIIEKIKEITK